jgi:putative peptidoglycan lipid II flippase
VGLVASSSGRLFASAFYALKDTRTPLTFATVRVATSALLAFYAVRVAPGQLGLPHEIGAVGITLASGLAARLELQLLRRGLARRIGEVRLAPSRLGALWTSAIVAAAAGLVVKHLLVVGYGPEPGLVEQWGGSWLPVPSLSPVLTATAVLGTYGILYLGITYVRRIPQARALLARVQAGVGSS